MRVFFSGDSEILTVLFSEFEIPNAMQFLGSLKAFFVMTLSERFRVYNVFQKALEHMIRSCPVSDIIPLSEDIVSALCISMKFDPNIVEEMLSPTSDQMSDIDDGFGADDDDGFGGPNSSDEENADIDDDGDR